MKKTDPQRHTVAQEIVRVLEEHGVQHVFGVPGEEVEELLFAIEESNIKFIPTRHEQGAAFIADVWGRLTQKIGVCLATLGPGATNLLTGLADAFLDKSPVLALTGQADTKRHHEESHQYLDMNAIFKPISKWNTVLKDPRKTTQSVQSALTIALSNKQGVTHIDIPEDVAEMPAQIGKPHLIKLLSKKATTNSIQKASTLLSNARRPVILVGNGVVRTNATKEFLQFVEDFQVPVISTFMAKGTISDRSELSLKTIGLKARDIQSIVLEKADLILSIGYDMVEYGPSNWVESQPIIHIDSDIVTAHKIYKPKVSLVGDIKSSLEMLHKVLKKSKLSPFKLWTLAARDAILKEHHSDTEGSTITVPFVLSELRHVLKDEDIVISDVGAHKMWIGRNFDCFSPNTCLISNGLASMGIALPGGIGATLAKPKVHVVSVMGDGGFLMNSQEIETAKRIGSKFVIVVLNDNDYGLISWKQHTARGRSVGTSLSNPDFVKYAQSFGIKAYKATKRENVKRTLKKAIESNQLCLVSIDIDPRANLALTKQLKNLNFKF